LATYLMQPFRAARRTRRFAWTAWKEQHYADFASGALRVAITLALPQRLQRRRFIKLAIGASGFTP
jgi:hypothetical protein